MYKNFGDFQHTIISKIKLIERFIGVADKNHFESKYKIPITPVKWKSQITNIDKFIIDTFAINNYLLKIKLIHLNIKPNFNKKNLKW